MKIFKRLVCFYLVILLVMSSVFAQDNSLAGTPFSSDRAAASEEFRRGVQSYFRGQFNEAILLFEKALSYLPGEPLIMDWLGKAYFRSGIEGAALKQWQFATESNYGGILLKSKIETITDRRSVKPEFLNITKYAEQTSLTNKVGTEDIFLQPTTVATMKDGSYWVVAYGSNELIHFDVNGIIIEKSLGPIQGFARPFDIIEMADGKLLVSEFSADKISVLEKNGRYITSFGSKGRGKGQLIGPQYLAQDAYNNIYVSDFGNARIAVFSPDGDPLFTFGEKSKVFEGFIDPAGIAVFDGLVYVADGIHGAVYIFDTAGNYQGELLPKGTLKGINSLKIWKEGLIVADLNSVYSLDVSTGALNRIVSLGKAPVRIVSVVPDANDNLMIVDYKNEKIEIASAIKELAGGLFITVDRVMAENFPNVTVDVRVQNRNGSPVVGLNDKNFFVTEKNRPVLDFNFDGAGYLSETCALTILIERSPASLADEKLINNACAEIIKATEGKAKVKIVTASDNPVLEQVFEYKSEIGKLNIKNTVSRNWQFDLGVRLSTAELLSASPKRAVIFLNTGSDLSHTFKTYSLNDLSAFMINNGIKFYSVNLHKTPVAPEIEFLAKTTGGKQTYIYNELGLKPIITDLLNSPNGMYRITYKSGLFSDFGRDFLPLEVEVRLLTRSGRDEIGYFAPLE